jgi:glycosyltransferase involved in cell wall biosynthesis
LKVLHVINGLGTGGAERSLAELVPALADRGIDSVIACLTHRAEGVESSVVASGVDVRFVPAGGLPTRVRHLRALLREVRPDVVHTSIFEADIAGRLATVGSRVRVVTTLVNMSYGPARSGDPNVARWRLLAVQAVDAATARFLTDRFVAITRAVADASVRDLRLRPRLVTVIPRGREGDRFTDASPAADRPRGATVVLHIGRHEFQKGIDVLIEALPSMLRARPDIVLVQAGRRGNASAGLEAQVARLGLDPAVQFLGHRDDVPALLAGADVFVFPSRYEGLGGSLIEAQAAGVAIVASDLAPIREVVEVRGTADVVPVGDADALAAAVVGLLDDDVRRARYAARGPEVFAERFTLDGVADAWATLLREVAR